jgi:hypothetical protein
MTPTHLPSSFRDRRAAISPTRVNTESRTSLLSSAKMYGSVSSSVLVVGCASWKKARTEVGWDGTGGHTLLFETAKVLSAHCLSHQISLLTPAVPYVYTWPSGGGCFCAASAIGSDIVAVVASIEAPRQDEAS